MIWPSRAEKFKSLRIEETLEISVSSAKYQLMVLWMISSSPSNYDVVT